MIMMTTIIIIIIIVCTWESPIFSLKYDYEYEFEYEFDSSAVCSINDDDGVVDLGL